MPFFLIIPFNHDPNRDPEGVTLGENLEILASLTSVLDRMENPFRGGGVKSENRDNAKTRAAAAVAKVHRLGLVPGVLTSK